MREIRNGTSEMIEFIGMIGSVLTALFTGGALYLAWTKSQPIVELEGVQVTEKECKMTLMLRNETRRKQSVSEISVVKPEHSVLCAMAAVRIDQSIPNRSHYSKSIDPRIEVAPGDDKRFEFYISKGIETEKAVEIQILTSWSKFPLIKRHVHKIYATC
jgi:hypothetical protein